MIGNNRQFLETSSGLRTALFSTQQRTKQRPLGFAMQRSVPRVLLDMFAAAAMIAVLMYALFGPIT
jgi:hypothetical protein